MSILASYNAKDVSLIAAGVYLTGVGEDKVEFEQNEDNFEYEVGADGDIVVSESNDKTATVTVTLQATSPSNRHMMKLADSKKPFPFWVIAKLNGMTRKAGGAQCRILKKPTGAFGTTAEDVEYEVIVFKYEDKVS